MVGWAEEDGEKKDEMEGLTRSGKDRRHLWRKGWVSENGDGGKERSAPSAYIRTGRSVGGLLILYGRWGSPSMAVFTKAWMSASVREAGLKADTADGTGGGSSDMMMGIVGREGEWLGWLGGEVEVPFASGAGEAGMTVAEGVRDWVGEVRVEVESMLRW
jgi:hypothetical protein